VTFTARLGSEMLAALELARQGCFRVEPNPLVGAVVLDRDGSAVGRGHHDVYGGPHAEVHALAAAGHAARGGTLVVTLEPCAHTAKKTPPCVEVVLSAGLARVVIGAADPNDATAGRAAPRLRAAGVEVVEGVEGAACAAALARYAWHRGTGVPWTIAKWAMSADGRSADAAGASRWISGPESRALVHELRARVEAVIVGAGTVVADDPRLTARDAAPSGLPPARRVVIDSGLRAPLERRVYTETGDAATTVICTAAAAPERRRALTGVGVVVEVVAADPDGRVDLVAAFRRLHATGVRRALLEAGPRLTGAALRAGVVRQVAAFTAPVIVGGDTAPTPFAGPGWHLAGAPRLAAARASACGADALLEGYLGGPPAGPEPGPTAVSRSG